MFFRIVIALLLFHYIYCNPHSHLRTGHKETTDHGTVSPRDYDHYKEGKHDTEFDHEAILGSHEKAEEFDQLPPEEAKKRLFSLALKMDANGDQFVEKEELIDWILKSFKSLTEEEAMDDLQEEDQNQDGQVTWEEHLAETYGMFGDDASVQPTEDMQLLEIDRQLFQAADLNSDGVLDSKEYPGFSHPEEFEHMHQTLYEQTMSKRDVNQDGFLSLEEFLADNHGSQPVSSTEHYAVEKDRFQNDFDLDKDRRLSREEVLLWLIPNNTETAVNEAEHLLESADTNRDDKLSIEEVVDHHEIFVGSEATDFGEQLQRDEL